MMFVSSLLDPTSLLLGGAVLLCVLWWLSTRRPPGLPPGPGPALPLLGHLHLLAKDPRPQFWTWRRQYGDVFSLYMGGRLVVVLASYSAICEALVTFADIFSNRPNDFSAVHIFGNKGILASSGAPWKEQRKTAVEILRAMGMGKNVLAEKIQEEITHYIQAIKDHQGAPVDLGRMTQVSISNNICSITMGRRFDYNDPEFITYLQYLDDTFRLLAGASILNFLPALDDIPGDPFEKQKVLAKIKAVFAFCRKQITAHKKMLEDGEEVETDFIFSYFRRIEDRKTRGVVNTTVNEDSLQNMVVDLFLAGSEAPSAVLLWALLYFLHYPEVQDKCFHEISDVIGDRLPSFADKPKLTYLEATICEVLRKADTVPLSGPHATADDVMFRGYFIPKGSTVFPFLSIVLQDPEIWGDPENFRPERFIGPDGKLVAKPDEFLPFGTGRRLCLGESIGRMELFLYLATILQHFRFLPAEEGQLPPLKDVFGIAVRPLPYKIRAVPRF